MQTAISCAPPISTFNKIKPLTPFVVALACALYSTGGIAQGVTCQNLPTDVSPLYNGCETTPVGVCDEEAAANFITGKGRNRWVVRSSNPEAERCSTVDLTDKNNPYVVTNQDDTNTLQCAIDFAAEGRVSTGLEGTIKLEDGRYCVRKAVIAIDFSGVIKGSGMDNAIIDVDAPVFRDAPPAGKERGIVLSGGLAGAEFDISKNSIRTQLVVESAFLFFDHEFDQRHVKFRDLALDIAEGTTAVRSTVDGLFTKSFSVGYESILSFIYDGDRFDSVYVDQSVTSGFPCGSWPARELSSTSTEYEEDTGVDLHALPPVECLMPYRDDVPRDSTRIDEDGNYIGDDLASLPSHSVSLQRIKSDMHGRAHNGVLFAAGQETLATAWPNARFFFSPYTGRYLIADSVILGGNDDGVTSRGFGNYGSPYDFLGNLWNGSIKVVRNYIGRSPSGIGSCGRWIENVSNKSGTTLKFSHNVIDQCRGAAIENGGLAFDGLGVDQVSLVNSKMPLPDMTVLIVTNNDFTQDPDDPALASSRFVLVSDQANNNDYMLDLGLEPRQTIEAQIANNRINVNSPATGDYLGAPILFAEVANSKITGNVITGANGAAISIGGFGYEDSGNKIKRNDLTGFEVVPCEFSGESVCSIATDAKIWLGSATHDNLIVSPKSDGGTDIVGDLGMDNVVLDE